jgi:putative serine protease PepD
VPPTPPTRPADPFAGARQPSGPGGPVSTSHSHKRRGRPALAFFAGLIVALMVGGVGFAIGRQNATTSNASATSVDPQPVTTTPTTKDSSSSSAPATATDEPAEAVAKTLSPAVVQIETDQGLGSGFIYDTDGHIMTAYHVVNGSDTVTIRLADGSVQKGKVLGSDAGTDVAVVKINGSANLPVAKLALDDVQVGQTAIAIGSPFGLDQTVTAGIISAVGRSMDTPGGAIPMLQTDAPINPGNSGGALANRNGEVIGINDSIESQSGSNAGVGFAIPISTAKSVADRLVNGEKIENAVLGVSGSDSQSGEKGALVTEVVNGSGADKAGLQQGDLITGIDGHEVSGMVDLAAKVRSHQPGDTVKLTVDRDGQSATVSVTLGKSSN